jgi:hypothetical protein
MINMKSTHLLRWRSLQLSNVLATSAAAAASNMTTGVQAKVCNLTLRPATPPEVLPASHTVCDSHMLEQT